MVWRRESRKNGEIRACRRSSSRSIHKMMSLTMSASNFDLLLKGGDRVNGHSRREVCLLEVAAARDETQGCAVTGRQQGVDQWY